MSSRGGAFGMRWSVPRILAAFLLIIVWISLGLLAFFVLYDIFDLQNRQAFYGAAFFFIIVGLVGVLRFGLAYTRGRNDTYILLSPVKVHRQLGEWLYFGILALILFSACVAVSQSVIDGIFGPDLGATFILAVLLSCGSAYGVLKLGKRIALSRLPKDREPPHQEALLAEMRSVAVQKFLFLAFALATAVYAAYQASRAIEIADNALPDRVSAIVTQINDMEAKRASYYADIERANREILNLGGSDPEARAKMEVAISMTTDMINGVDKRIGEAESILVRERAFSEEASGSIDGRFFCFLFLFFRAPWLCGYLSHALWDFSRAVPRVGEETGRNPQHPVFMLGC